MTTVLWRRLDLPGHDACRLVHCAGDHPTWRLEGTAVFLHDGAAARLSYRVDCDRSWLTLDGHVRGWLGTKAVDVVVARTRAGSWTLDGAVVEAPADCVDLDLGFTPATNLIALRRLALAEGQAADAPAAWLDVATGTLARLPQRYERRTPTSYWYEAPSVGYAGRLELDPHGFVRRYPGLWEREPAG